MKIRGCTMLLDGHVRPFICNRIITYTRRHITTTKYCVDIIRKYDYENYVCSLLLETRARSCAIAIRAFNAEVARLQDQISSLEMGNVRFKFWEDAVERCFERNNNKIPNHPVMLELYRVLQKNQLTKRRLLAIVDSRRNIMLSNGLQTIEAMEEYAEKSASAVLYLILEGGGVKNVNADHAASHLGKAQGLCQLLRGVAAVGGNSSRLAGLPRQLLVECKVSEEDVERRRGTVALREVVFRVATRADQHLRKSRSLSSSLPDDARAVLLPATPVHHYLQRLLRADCDLFVERLKATNYMWIPHVWYKRLFRTY